MVSTRDPRISVGRDRHFYYRGVYTENRYNNADYTELLQFERDPEVQSRWCSRSPELLIFASESGQLAVVNKHGWAIKHIENPSEAVQLAAVRQDGYAIRFIRNPSEAVQLAAVRESGYAIANIKNPSEAVQLAAVQENAWSIGHIENPSEAVQLAARLAAGN